MDTKHSNSFEQSHFFAKYGNEEFIFSIYMANNEGYFTYLNRNSLMFLEIDDNIFNPFHTATMIIANDQNVIEKSTSPYVFLGNGRDVVNIEIMPAATGEFDKNKDDEKMKEWLRLKFNFVVVEATEITYNNTVCKKLMLIEWAQYAMSENICSIFGMQKAGAVVGNYMETNAGNGKPTGEVIKSILYAVYNDNAPSEELFFRDPRNNQKIFDEDGESQINLNPYGVMSYMEVLNYVLGFHSYKKSPCILQYDRHQKKFLLVSLYTAFKSHKINVIETLKFPSLSQSNSSTNNNKKEGASIVWKTFPVTFEESKINQFYIESPSCKDNVILAGNAGIMSCSRSYKSMIFNMKTLNSESFMKDYYDLFVKPFKDEFTKDGSQKYEVFPNFYPNPNKKNNYDTHKGVLPPEMDEKKFLNQKLSSLLYLNNIYQFKLTGKTHRKSLAFVDVIKTAENKDGKFTATKYDMNVLGRHFITSVKHVFEFNTYRNEIETIKPYRLVDGDENGTKLEEFLQKGI